MYIKRCILGVSFIYKAELKKRLIGHLVKTFIKGRRSWPIKLSNKSKKRLMSSGLGIKPLYWRNYSLRCIRPRLYRSYNLCIV